jgi:hypothetical protein
MTFRSQPMDPVMEPARYPYPDWDAIGTVTRIWVEEGETIGWLVRQGEDRIAWFSSVGPDNIGVHVQYAISQLLRDGARAGTPMGEVWDEARTKAWSTTPQEVHLPALMADIRKAWGTD